MMSEDSSTPVSKDAAVKKGGLHRVLGIYEIVSIVLIALSTIGIGITDVFLWKHCVGGEDG
jgi:hypothetical protein